jgi:hypothetical protein
LEEIQKNGGKKNKNLISLRHSDFLNSQEEQEKKKEESKYTVEYYLNGILDIKASYGSHALSNNATLQLFKDLSFNGETLVLLQLTGLNSSVSSVSVVFRSKKLSSGFTTMEWSIISLVCSFTLFKRC